MAATKGPALLVKQGDGETIETFATLAGVRSKTIQQGTERIDTTSDDDVSLDGVSHRTFTPGIMNFEIQVGGIAKGVSESQRLVADGRAGTIRNYEVVWPTIGYWKGPMFLGDFQVTAEYEGVIEFSATLSSNEAVDWFPETATPENTLAPSVSGVAQAGEIVTGLPGVWSGSPSFAYQWQHQVDGAGAWANITGATAQTYTISATYVTDALRVVVTATNSAGSASANSAATAIVIAAD